MKITTTLLSGLLSATLPLLATAQNAYEYRNQPNTTTNIYAQEHIEMGVGFSATTAGFEAKIRMSAEVAGRWSAPLPWTDYQSPQQGAPRGMIGIHTHVLPNGKVLSWEGHNDDDHVNTGTGAILSHAYEWNPNPNARNGTQAYPNVYSDFDITSSNIFCSGHTFLADGRLLVAGGHYSGGKVYGRGASLNGSFNAQIPVNNSGNDDYIPPSPPLGNVNGVIGLRDANIFDYRGSASAGSNYVWQPKRPMTYRRWYPTTTTLGNGEVVAVAGQRYGGPVGTNTSVQAEIPEVYNPTTDTWLPLTGAPLGVMLYPWMAAGRGWAPGAASTAPNCPRYGRPARQ